MRWNGFRVVWDGMGWKEIGRWNGMGWDGMGGRRGKGRGGTELFEGGVEWRGMGWEGKRWDMVI